MAGFLRIAPVLQHDETMNHHPNDDLETQWWETSLKTHRHWLLLLLFFFLWIFKWCVATANFFPWPSLKEHWNSLQWEKLDLFDHVTNISFIQKHDLSVSPCHADARGSPSCLPFGPLEFAKFSLHFFITFIYWMLRPKPGVPSGTIKKIFNFFYYCCFLKLILCFRFTFEWLISIDLRNDGNNSVTCIESYTVFQ